MTNIIAAIIITTVTTNWATVSTTSPTIAPGHEYDLVMRYSTANQIGARVTNTVALVEWKGEYRPLVLESTKPFYSNDLKRSVPVYDGSYSFTIQTNGVIYERYK